MSNTDREHFYYVDPGVGDKSKGCPYTFYQDGHDVRSFIIPPEGYELTEFKLEPYPEDTFYDGKIVAQYQKIPFSRRLKKSLLKYVLILCSIIGILAILAFGYRFYNHHKHKPMARYRMKPKTEIKSSRKNTVTIKKVADPSKITTDTISEKLHSDTTTKGMLVDEIVSMAVEQKATEEVAKIEEIAAKVAEAKPNEESQPKEVLTKEQFHQEFWDLIHRQESRMYTYHKLYKKYKDLNLKSKEYYYLYLTILENTTQFDVWKNKMVSIPKDEIASINTISELKEKIEEYE
ncbi:MAG: hypothetical protein IJQ83_05010 [Bacteroidales bacterium]|nr:hypothetical protein [Bacteroidales bacterium]